MTSDLEKRLFEVEKDRIRLRRDRDDCERELTRLQAGKDRGEVNSDLLQMIHANQARLADANASLTALVARQEREADEREAIWGLQVKEMKALL